VGRFIHFVAGELYLVQIVGGCKRVNFFENGLPGTGISKFEYIVGHYRVKILRNCQKMELFARVHRDCSRVAIRLFKMVQCLLLSKLIKFVLPDKFRNRRRRIAWCWRVDFDKKYSG
jgi:hypothetical protein